MTTYYVATNGSDSGNGTSGSPWRTISKAMKANLKPGDEVVVRSGTYKEAVDVNKDGAAGATSPCAPKCPAAPRSTSPDGKSCGIHINANYVKVDGFEVYGSTRFRYHAVQRSITSRSPITSSTTTSQQRDLR